MLLSVQPDRALDSFKPVSCETETVVSESAYPHFYRQPLNDSQILVVDNHIDTCDLYTLVLEEAGAKVVVTNSCEKALIQIQKNPPDILISEIELPGENGLTLIRKVRKLMLRVGQAPLTLAVTSHVEREDQSEIASAGFNRYLSKPVDIFELVDVVSKLLKQKRCTLH